jgi:hypothetical protein
MGSYYVHVVEQDGSVGNSVTHDSREDARAYVGRLIATWGPDETHLLPRVYIDGVVLSTDELLELADWANQAYAVYSEEYEPAFNRAIEKCREAGIRDTKAHNIAHSHAHRHAVGRKHFFLRQKEADKELDEILAAR